MPSGADRLQRAVNRYFSFMSDRLYDEITVGRVFGLLGGRLNELVLAQGRRAVDVADGGPILDMPVGTAYFAAPTARLHPGPLVGVDLAEGMVRRAREVAQEEGAPNLRVVRADAHHLPFADATFPAILCSNGLPVIPGLGETVTELARVLAPGGTLFVSAITLPVSAALPAASAAHLPAALRSERDLVGSFVAAGLTITATMRERLALLVEATNA